MSKGVGMISGADPTATGGMSQQALAEELMTKHGYTPEQMDEFREFTATGRRKNTWRLDAWRAMIDATNAERRNRELEAAASKAEEEVSDTSDEPLLITDPDTYDYIFNGHAGAGPSSSERWMSCTASLAASRTFLETLTPKQQAEYATASTAAQQGTTAHMAAEIKANVMLGRLDEDVADFHLMELAFLSDSDDVAYDDEMDEFIQEYVDLVKMYADDGHEILIETRVSAAVWLNDEDVYEVKGSADFGALPTKSDNYLIVGDLKYGQGIEVDVENNSQIRIYGLGMLARLVDEDGNLPDIDGIRYYIAQPRLGGIKKWEESVDDLLDWRDEVLAPALALALAGPKGGATYEPSESACQFCPARGSCPALIESTLAKADTLFDAVMEAELNGDGEIPVDTLDSADLGELLKQVQDLVKIEKEMKSEALRRMYRGEEVPGFKLVNYQPGRSWTAEAEDAFADNEDMWETKLKSPAKAESLAKTTKNDDLKQMVDGLSYKPDPQPKVAAHGDRRSSWVPPNTADSMFPETK